MTVQGLVLACSLLLPTAVCDMGGEAEKFSATRLALEGASLSDADAAQLEAALNTDPSDMEARTRLLGYYFGRRSDERREARQRHVLWVIENRPESEIAGTPWASLDAHLDSAVYPQAHAAWLAIVDRRPEDPRILRNAAEFMTLNDAPTSRRLLERGEALDPSDPAWARDLGHLESLGRGADVGRSRKALEHYERALGAGDDSSLAEAAKLAVETGDLDKAKVFATRLLEKAENEFGFVDGDAIHHGHLVLGRTALRQADMDSAKRHLLEAGRTPGSPPLNSFGPNMALAKELLEKGERTAVLQYFDLCGKFWRDERLAEWSAAVKRSEVPDFGANLVY
jgi:tetratricopeptide (TPR) repeat protein